MYQNVFQLPEFTTENGNICYSDDSSEGTAEAFDKFRKRTTPHCLNFQVRALGHPLVYKWMEN